jgi:hypothetical protein
MDTGSSVTENSGLSMSVTRSNNPGISHLTENFIQKTQVFNRKFQFNEQLCNLAQILCTYKYRII